MGGGEQGRKEGGSGEKNLGYQSKLVCMLNVSRSFFFFFPQGFYIEAAGFYESTLNFQPEFKPAADRLKTVRCLLLMARNQHLREKEKKQTAAAKS